MNSIKTNIDDDFIIEHVQTRIKEIDFLRVFAMMLIFAQHNDFAFDGGTSAVALFFMISGFCMTLAYGNKVCASDFRWKSYILKKALKYYPIHIFAFLFLLVFVRRLSIDLSLRSLVITSLNVSLLQSWIPLKEVYFSYNSPSWFLCDLLFMVALFPWLYRLLCSTSKWIKVIISIVVIAIYIALQNTLTKDMSHALLYINPIVRLMDFMAGIFIAEATIVRKRPIDSILHTSPCLFQVLVVILLILIVVECTYNPFSDELSTLSYWPLNILLLICMVKISTIHNRLSKLFDNRLIEFLSSISMSFYMLHMIVLGFANKIYKPFGCNQKSWEGALVCFLITIILSYFTHKYIEVKLSNKIKESLI